MIFAQVMYTVALFASPTADPSVTTPIAVVETFADTALVCTNLTPATLTSTVVLDQTLTLQGTWENKGTCNTPPLPLTRVPACLRAPCLTYAVFVKSEVRGLSRWSLAATPLVTMPLATNPIPPECAAPLGNRAVGVFITSVQATTGRPNSRSRLNYQLSSPNSPIVFLAVRIDGVSVATLDGAQLLDTAGVWFPVPATGAHSLSLLATNAYGCSREQAAPSLIVP